MILKTSIINCLLNCLQKKTDVDSAFEGMLLLVTENPRSGLSLHGKDDEQEIHSKDVSSLDYTITKISATGINPDFLCILTSFAKSSLLYLILLAASKYFKL